MTEKIIVECPSCQVRFFVTDELLGIANGALRCGFCQQIFNGLESIVEEAVPLAPPEPTAPEEVRVEKPQEHDFVQVEEFYQKPEPSVSIKEEPVEEQPAETEVVSVKKILDVDYSEDYWMEVANAFSDISKMGSAEQEVVESTESIATVVADLEPLKAEQPLHTVDEDILDYLETVDFDSLLQDKYEADKKPKSSSDTEVKEEPSSASVAIQRLRASMQEPAFTPDSLESLEEKLLQASEEEKALEAVMAESFDGSLSEPESNPSLLEKGLDLSLESGLEASLSASNEDPFDVLLQNSKSTPVEESLPAPESSSEMLSPRVDPISDSLAEDDPFQVLLQKPESIAVEQEPLPVSEPSPPTSRRSSLDLDAKPLYIDFDPASNALKEKPIQVSVQKPVTVKPSSLSLDVKPLHITSPSLEPILAEVKPVSDAKPALSSTQRPKPVLTLVETTPLPHKEPIVEPKTESMTMEALESLQEALQEKSPYSSSTEALESNKSEVIKDAAAKNIIPEESLINIAPSDVVSIDDFIFDENLFEPEESFIESDERVVKTKDPEYSTSKQRYSGNGVAKDIYGNQLKVVADIDFDVPSKKIVTRSTVVWAVLSAVAILVLGAQYLHYSAPLWAKTPAKRPLAESICGYLGCHIAPFVDAGMIKTEKLVVRSSSEYQGVLDVDALLYNNAAFVQAYPAIELRFTNYNGQAVASRVFAPSEYLNEATLQQNQMPKAVPVRISLQVADPTEEAVGYELHFSPANRVGN